MSCVSIQKKRPIFVILREEYFDITNNFCAAKLIEYFIRWTEWKVKNHRTAWVYQPLRRIYDDLLGEHCLHAIRDAIKLLEELGLLEKRHNPGNRQDNTWQYKLNVEVLNNLLEHGEFRNEQDQCKTEQLHKDNPISSNPQQYNAAVEEEEMWKATWEEIAREMEMWGQEQDKNLIEGVELSELANEVISQEALLSGVALKDVEIESILVQCDESDASLEIGSQSQTAIAPANLAQEEEERIPRVIVTSYVPGAIAISSVPQVQKPQEQSGSGLGVVRQEAIAPANFTQQELDTIPRVTLTPGIERAIATSIIPQGQKVNVSEPHLSKGISSPLPVNSLPVVPKKLSQAELDAIEDELMRLRINPDSCISVIKKYWENVGGAIARVKEALQQGWCANPTGLFINSCKKGIKPQKSQVSNDVSEWFNWARKQRIVIAMTGGTAYTPEGEPVSIREMMELYPMRT